tara:strand:- start:1535 stop:2047 length:513 start_codon:yes stop_codon:yes gene_type:complete
MDRYCVEIVIEPKGIKPRTNTIKERINMENYVKLLFSHDALGEGSVESAWAQKVEKGYQLDNILFYAKNYSWKDIVSAEEINGELFATGLVEEKGHSTVRVLLSDASEVPKLREEIKNFGCSSELSNVENLVAIDIPPSVSYDKVRAYLEKGEDDGRWEYQEACIASNQK